jgi:hypothetical protein
MNHRQLLAAAAAGCLSLFLSTALAAKTGGPGTPTVVLVDSKLGDLHYLPLSAETIHVDTSFYQPYAANYADVVGGALGGALAASIIREQAAVAAQQRADATLFDLTEPLGEKGLNLILRDAFDEALAAHGMDQQALVFSGRAVPNEKMLPRIPAARKAETFVLVRVGERTKGLVDLPVAMHDSLRQFRLGVGIEILEGDFERPRRVARRDVTVYTDVMDFAEGEDPLAALGANEQARLRAELGRAVTTAVALVLAKRDLPKVGKDDEVGALNAVGMTEFKGVLVEEADGRALIWTRDDSLVSIPAQQVLTGEALVAARAEEANRRTPPAEKAEIADGSAKDPDSAKVAGVSEAEAATEAGDTAQAAADAEVTADSQGTAVAGTETGASPAQPAAAPATATDAQEEAASDTGPSPADGAN